MPSPDAPESRGGWRRSAATAGWFVLGFACLALASTLLDALFTSVPGVLEVIERSGTAAALVVTSAAFCAGLLTILLTRRHARLGREALRATWAIGVLDVGIGLVQGVRTGPGASAQSLSEGLGFLLAAAAVAVLSGSAAQRGSSAPHDD